MADGMTTRMRAAADQLSAAVASGNVMTSSSGDLELMGLSAATIQAQEQHASALRTFEARRRAATVVVPVNDDEVKFALRSLGAPICLFGERLVDRRERLKHIIAEKQVDAEMLGESIPNLSILQNQNLSHSQVKQEKQTKTFYTEASDQLVVARKAIAQSSWQRAKERLSREYNTPEVSSFSASSKSKTVRLEMTASINEPRPVSACSFSPDGHVVTASFDGTCRVYKTSGDYGLVSNLKGHSERICDVAARPVVTTPEVVAVSGSAEGELRLWRGETCAGVLQGHVQRVGRVVWDPTGRWFVSTSYDRTWRLWDAEQAACLLIQDGYAKEVYATAFHPDGSLVAACDLGAAVLVWDTRAGKCTHQFAGHVMGVLSADFSVNGHTLATAGLDNQVRIWDLRKKETLQVIPAHLKPITKVKFHPTNGGVLATASHDRSIRVWDSISWKRLSSLMVHDGPVLGMDVAGDMRIATSGYDRTFRIVDAKIF